MTESTYQFTFSFCLTQLGLINWRLDLFDEWVAGNGCTVLLFSFSPDDSNFLPLLKR